MSAPLISICLPVKNGARFLDEALQSLLQQDEQRFEILIADDLSNDNSFQIAEGYAASDRRIKLWRNQRALGLFANYNQCLRNARGQYIKPMAQDDLLEPSMLSNCLQVFSNDPGIALVSVAKKIKSETDCIYRSCNIEKSIITYHGRLPKYTRHQVYDACLMPIQNLIGEPCTVMFASRAVDGGFNETLHHLGDLEYWLRILQHGDYAFLDKTLAIFRQHSDSATHHNLINLSIPADLVICADLLVNPLAECGFTPEDFLQTNLSAFSRIVHDQQSIQTESALLDNPLKRALLQSLLLIAHHKHDLPDTVNIIAKIKQLERQNRKLTSSYAWQITRILREGKRMLIFNGLSAPHYPKSNVGDFGTHASYLHYLKRSKQRILTSMSWKVGKCILHHKVKMGRMAEYPCWSVLACAAMTAHCLVLALQSSTIAYIVPQALYKHDIFHVATTGLLILLAIIKSILSKSDRRSTPPYWRPAFAWSLIYTALVILSSISQIVDVPGALHLALIPLTISSFLFCAPLLMTTTHYRIIFTILLAYFAIHDVVTLTSPHSAISASGRSKYFFGLDLHIKDSWYSNANTIGSFLMYWPAIIFSGMTFIPKALQGAIGALAIAPLFMTFSRAPQLTAALALIPPVSCRLKKAPLISTICLLALCAWMYHLTAPILTPSAIVPKGHRLSVHSPEYKMQYRANEAKEPIAERTAVWKCVIEQMKQNGIILGHGPIQAAYKNLSPHNFILANLAYYGIFGLSSLICMLCLCSMAVWHRTRTNLALMPVATLLLSVICVHGQLEYVLTYPLFFSNSIFWILLGFAAFASNNALSKPEKNHP